MAIPPRKNTSTTCGRSAVGRSKGGKGKGEGGGGGGEGGEGEGGGGEGERDGKRTGKNSSHPSRTRMPFSA